MGAKMQEEKDKKSELRKRAEAKLAALGEQAQELSQYDSRVLIHELRTHQIELEMQNEELRQSEQALSDAHDQLSDLYDFAPIGYVTLNDKAVILQSNLTAASMLATERGELIGQTFSAFVADSRTFGEYLNSCLHSHERVVADVTIKAQGGEFSAQLTGMAVNGAEPNSKVVRLTITDISLHKLSQQALDQALQILQNDTSRPARMSSQGEGELRHAIDNLKTYTRLSIERELRMVELKKEINGLRKELGRNEKYAAYSSPKSGERI